MVDECHAKIYSLKENGCVDYANTLIQLTEKSHEGMQYKQIVPSTDFKYWLPVR